MVIFHSYVNVYQRVCIPLKSYNLSQGTSPLGDGSTPWTLLCDTLPSLRGMKPWWRRMVSEIYPLIMLRFANWNTCFFFIYVFLEKTNSIGVQVVYIFYMCIYISMCYRRKRPVVWLTFSSPRFLKIKLQGHYLWPGQAFRSRSWDVIDYQYQVRKNTFKVGFTQCHKPIIWRW